MHCFPSINSECLPHGMLVLHASSYFEIQFYCLFNRCRISTFPFIMIIIYLYVLTPVPPARRKTTFPDGVSVSRGSRVSYPGRNANRENIVCELFFLFNMEFTNDRPKCFRGYTIFIIVYSYTKLQQCLFMY